VPEILVMLITVSLEMAASGDTICIMKSIISYNKCLVENILLCLLLIDFRTTM